jgi:hypothetical protein
MVHKQGISVPAGMLLQDNECEGMAGIHPLASDTWSNPK